MIEFHCGHCEKVLRTSDDKAGRQATCPGCGNVVVIPGNREEPEDALIIEDDESFSQKPVGPAPAASQSSARMQCPECGEFIRAGVERCKFCDAKVGEPGRHREMRPFPPGEVISEAFRIYGEQWAVLTGAYVVMSLLIVMASAIFVVPVMLLFAIFNKSLDNLDAITLVFGISGGVVFSLLIMALSFYLQSGFMVMCLKVVRQEPTTLSDLFSGRRYWVRVAVTTILFNILVGIGILFCVVPGLFIGAILLPYWCVLIAEDSPAIDSFFRAKKLTDGNWGSMFLIVLMSAGCYFGASQICGILLLAIMPYCHILQALAYQRMTYQTPIEEIGNQAATASL